MGTDVLMRAIDPDDTLVTVCHPHGDLEVPLREWIRVGPGPRKLVTILAARRKSSGVVVPMHNIPLAYHNSPTSRILIRIGLLADPWPVR